jgi:D-alanine-D-alanine ligase
MSRRRVMAVVFGGRSVEHEVSLVSGRTVIEAADPARYEVIPVLVDRDGRWYTGEAGDLVRPEREAPPDRRVLPPTDPTEPWLRAPGGEPASPPLEVVFPLVHGTGGEDGSLQGLLETAGIPYVGPGVLASAVGMDKEVAKRLLDAAGLAVVPWERVGTDEWRLQREEVLQRLEAFGLPAFVKPACGGSSVGIRRADTVRQLAAALDHAFDLDVKVVVEKAVDGREIECAVLGNRHPRSAGPGEILPGNEFYDYEAKYGDAGSQVLIPAPLTDDLAEEARQLAARAFTVLELEGMARVDFLLERGSNRFFVSEVNTLPGFTAISLYPKAWEQAGLPLPDLVDRLVELALERATVRAGLRTRWRPGD